MEKLDLKKTKTVNPLEFENRKNINETYLFQKSKFKFVNDHFGFRNSKMHIILGTTGSGKTTLLMSLIDEMLVEKKKILFYSCEETVEDFETKFGYSNAQFDEKLLMIFHENKMLSLLNNDTLNINEFEKQLGLAILQNKPDVFIFDNITTSAFYDQNKLASETAKRIKKLCDNSGIPFIVIAHTASSVKEGQFFDSSCIRGFRSITNTAQYVYCYMRLREEFMGRTTIVNCIYTDKSRGHSDASRACYKLSFDAQKKIFTSDQQIEYASFKKYFKASQK